MYERRTAFKVPVIDQPPLGLVLLGDRDAGVRRLRLWGH